MKMSKDRYLLIGFISGFYEYSGFPEYDKEEIIYVNSTKLCSEYPDDLEVNDKSSANY